MNSVYGYDDYRAFLRDYFHSRKQNASGYSLKKFSQEVGLGSPNYLKLILDGDRQLTISNIHKIANGIGLTIAEQGFFETLVLFNQAKEPDELRFYKNRLREFVAAKPKKMHKLTMNDLIRKWYYPAVWVCLEGKSALQIESVAKTVGITTAEAKEVVDALCKAGLVTEKDGYCKLVGDYLLYHDKKLLSKSQKSYLRDQLERSRREFENNYSKESKFYSHTFTISRERFDFYVDALKSFMESLTESSNKETPERIIQLNMQLFPIGKEAS